MLLTNQINECEKPPTFGRLFANIIVQSRRLFYNKNCNYEFVEVLPVKKIELRMFSKKYDVRKLNEDDVEMLYDFCKRNTQYYEYCGKDISIELIESDLKVTPPGIPMEQKYYLGFFEEGKLTAIMDLVDGYPSSNYVFIGFFMMNSELQGKGIGSKIISEVFNYLKTQGFEKCQLGIDKDNPQSNHFWKKNGFEIVKEVEIEEGIVLVAEKQL